jgi:AraC-like DNA-binding protein
MKQQDRSLSPTKLAPSTSSPLVIRKSLLQALDEKIIPLASAGCGPRFIWGEPPLQVPEGVTVKALDVAPLEEHGDESPRREQSWPALHVHTSQFPYIAYVFEGEADLRVGTTQTMARSLEKRNPSVTKVMGCHMLELPSPAVVLFPPGVAYSDGSRPHWNRAYEPAIPARIFWIRLLPSGVLCHLSTHRGKKLLSEHSLVVQDQRLPVMAEILSEELRERPPAYQQVAQTQFLGLLLRLRRRLALDTPVVANTAAFSTNRLLQLPVGDHDNSLPHERSARAHSVFSAVDAYIRIHLSEPLTLRFLAEQVKVSPAYLNRLFKAAGVTSVMQHVIACRMDAARRLLQVNPELSVTEVAQLCGYANRGNFWRVFMHTYKTTPRAYRSHYEATRRDSINIATTATPTTTSELSTTGSKATSKASRVSRKR